jgi:nitrogen regulatory protein P-II 1
VEVESFVGFLASALARGSRLRGTEMKEIKAILQPHALTRVLGALHQLPHFPGVTVSDCQGQGRGRGKGGSYLLNEETMFFSRKSKLEIFCADALCNEIVEIVQRAAHTGNPGDGVVMVVDLDRVVRIRTSEEEDEAV